MDTVFNIQLHQLNPRRIAYAHKMFEGPLPLAEGMLVSDGAWPEPRRIEKVTLSLPAEKLFADFKRDDTEAVEALIEKYQFYDWEVVEQ